jgi:DDE superfamily endonuclease
MPFSHLPALLTSAFLGLAHWLDRRSAARLPRLLCGLLFARGRRTVTSWFRAAGITDEFRPAYATVCAAGRHTRSMAVTTLSAVEPLLGRGRLRVALDDTPTPRYGPEVEGAGVPTTPAGAPPAPSTSTATSGSPSPPWPATPPGAPSPCPCGPSCTSAGPTWATCPPGAAAPSAPSWSWPPNNSPG